MKTGLTLADLVAFEKEIERVYLEGKIAAPVHFSSGNEAQLIKVFEMIGERDWVLGTHRSHYAALLRGIPPERVKAEILAGHSIDLHFADYRFLTSAIVGGCLPIALGIALGIKRTGGLEHVWCFVGDMAALGGAFWECSQYAARQRLPISFIVEDNGLSVNSPTDLVWGPLGQAEWWGVNGHPHVLRYNFVRGCAHIGVAGKWVVFS